MKVMASNTLCVGLLIAGLCVSGCQQSPALKTSAQATPKPTQPARTKKAEVSISSPTNRSSVTTVTTSFAVGPKSKPDIAVYWNGYGFIVKEDSGSKIWEHSDELAFSKRSSAQFLLRRKVTITDEGGYTTVSTSETVTVKCGVPATF